MPGAVPVPRLGSLRWQTPLVVLVLVGCAPERAAPRSEATKQTTASACRLVPAESGFMTLLDSQWFPKFLDRHAEYAEDHGVSPITKKIMEERHHPPNFDIWCAPPRDAPAMTSGWERCRSVAIVVLPKLNDFLHFFSYLMSAEVSAGGQLVACIHAQYQKAPSAPRYCGFTVTPAVQAIPFWDTVLTRLVALPGQQSWNLHRAVAAARPQELEIGAFMMLRNATDCECTEPYKTSWFAYQKVAYELLYSDDHGEPDWTSPL